MNLAAAVWSEILKARRSRMPLLTALGFSLVPLMGGFFMILLRDPEFARRVGLLRTKAQLVAGLANWPMYFGLISYATAVAGILLFAIVASWVFGREFSDHTVMDLLALPTPRSTIVFAKFIAVGIWSGALSGIIYVLGLVFGAIIGLPEWSTEIAAHGASVLAMTTFLIVLLMSPVALFASIGRGYLAPMGFSIVVLVLAQFIAAAGWGPYFPWSVPALFSGLDNSQPESLNAVSYFLLFLVCIGAFVGTFAWWQYSDQTV